MIPRPALGSWGFASSVAGLPTQKVPTTVKQINKCDHVQEVKMSDLIVVGFDSTTKADEVLWRLRAMQSQDLVDLEDAVVVIRDQAGRVQLKQSIDLADLQASSGLLAGSFLGGLIGMLFLNPTAGFLLGGMFGAGAGALSGSLADYGIEDDFIKSLARTIPNNSSALSVLARKARLDKVLAELSDVGGKVLQTTLSSDQEKRLQEALAGSSSSAGGHS